MGALRSHGLGVGRDVAVVGFNDTSLAAELPIPLSSVRSPMLDIGRTAVQPLKGVLDGRKVESVKLKPVLCVRKAAPSATRCDTAMGSSSQSNESNRKAIRARPVRQFTDPTRQALSPMS